MSITIVTPRSLRAAARTIIVEGVEGDNIAARKSSSYWAAALSQAFREHYDEVMGLSQQYPPGPEPERRLLALVKDGVEGIRDRALIQRAIDLPEGTSLESETDAARAHAVWVDQDRSGPHLITTIFVDGEPAWTHDHLHGEIMSDDLITLCNALLPEIQHVPH